MTVSAVRINDIQVAYRWDGPQGAPVLMMAHAMGTSLQQQRFQGTLRC